MAKYQVIYSRSDSKILYESPVYQNCARYIHRRTQVPHIMMQNVFDITTNGILLEKVSITHKRSSEIMCEFSHYSISLGSAYIRNNHNEGDQYEINFLWEDGHLQNFILQDLEVNHLWDLGTFMDLIIKNAVLSGSEDLVEFEEIFQKRCFIDKFRIRFNQYVLN